MAELVVELGHLLLHDVHCWFSSSGGYEAHVSMLSSSTTGDPKWMMLGADQSVPAPPIVPPYWPTKALARIFDALHVEVPGEHSLFEEELTLAEPA